MAVDWQARIVYFSLSVRCTMVCCISANCTRFVAYFRWHFIECNNMQMWRTIYRVTVHGKRLQIVASAAWSFPNTEHNCSLFSVPFFLYLRNFWGVICSFRGFTPANSRQPTEMEPKCWEILKVITINVTIYWMCECLWSICRAFYGICRSKVSAIEKWWSRNINWRQWPWSWDRNAHAFIQF